MYLYRRLVESSPDGILVVEDGRIAYANRAAADLFGVPDPERLLGDSLFDHLEADCQASVRKQLLSWQEGFPALLLDVKVVRPDGQLHDISMTGAPAYEDGPSVQVILRDITERKDAERALRESEERLALAVAGGLEGVWDWNLETNAVVYSSRWKSMLGYSDDEIEPHVSAWERLLHPDDRAAVQEVVDGVLRGERDYTVEFRLCHKDGHYVHVLSRGFPVRRQPDGFVIRIVGTHFDLSERKRVEEVFAWLKTVALQRKTRFRGPDRVGRRRLARGGRRQCRRLRQLCVAVHLHVRHLPQAALRRVLVVSRSGVGSVRHRGHDGGGLFAAAGPAAGSGQRAARHHPGADDLRVRLRVAGAADAPPLASLRRVRRARDRW
jgi:PAS domain S-box-containing protein